MVSVETPSKNMRTTHPNNEWMGGRYFLSNGSREGFQKFLIMSADKLIFRLRKVTKVPSKLLRPSLISTFKSKSFYKLKPPLKISKSATVH